MFISVDKGDFGWRVFVDGVEADYAVSADTTSGEVEVLCTKEGEFIIDGDHVIRQKLTGTVTVERM